MSALQWRWIAGLALLISTSTVDGRPNVQPSLQPNTPPSAPLLDNGRRDTEPGEEPITLKVPTVSPPAAQPPPIPLTPSEPAGEEANATAAGMAPTVPGGALDGGSGEPAEVLVNANRAYEAGEYRRAIELYNQLLASGLGDGRLFYNLGNSYLRNGQLGYAIAAYRRAAALRPRDQEIAANLAFARKSTRNDLTPPAPSQLQRTLFFWHYQLSRGELLRLLVLANLALWSFLALRRRHRQSEVIRWLLMVALVLTLALASSLALRLARPSRVAVVVPQEITAHSGNDVESTLRFKLQTGAEVRVVEERAGWLRIELPNGQQGWIDQSHAEVVVDG